MAWVRFDSGSVDEVDNVCAPVCIRFNSALAGYDFDTTSRAQFERTEWSERPRSITCRVECMKDGIFSTPFEF